MWLTKDVNLPEPIQISADKEQGSYVFFNHNLWEKTRVSLDLLEFYKPANDRSGSTFRTTLWAIGTKLGAF